MNESTADLNGFSGSRRGQSAPPPRRTGMRLLGTAGWFGPLGLRITWLAIATFVCGVATGRAVNLIGEFYLGELLLIQLAVLVMLFGRDRSLLDVPVFGIFVQTAVLMLAGYMLSDLYRDTEAGQFLRGWARVILLSLDFIGLAVIAAREKQNLWWFVLGMGVGAIGQLLVRGVPMMSAPGWKFGYAQPLVYLLACFSYFLPVKIAALAFASLGVWNIYMDFRIMGGICLVVSAVLWVRASSPDGLSGYQILKLFTVCLIAGGIIAATLFVTNEEYGRRRESSNVGRENALLVAVKGIIDSPIVGYGSWPTEPKLVDLYVQHERESGQLAETETNVSVFTAHSQILQAWVEGGILGVIFWVFYLLQTVSAARYSVLHRTADGYLPILLFFLFINLWNLFMSPFSGPHRVPISVSIALICLCAMERHLRRSPVGAGVRPA